jgi:hypothetical protein
MKGNPVHVWHGAGMDDQTLTTSQMLRFSAELPVLSPELMYENTAYTGNFVDLKGTKEFGLSSLCSTEG